MRLVSVKSSRIEMTAPIIGKISKFCFIIDGWELNFIFYCFVRKVLVLKYIFVVVEQKSKFAVSQN